MWNHMAGQGMSTGMGFSMVLWIGIAVWFVVFSILVIGKLNRIVQLLEKK